MADRSPPRRRVVIITEGTYPFVVGGVSTWCQDLIAGLPDFDWSVVPITAGGVKRTSLFELPPNAEVHHGIDLWGPNVPGRPTGWPRLRRRGPGGPARSSNGDQADRIPVDLTRLVMSPDSPVEELAELFARCRRNPAMVRQAFRSRTAWGSVMAALPAILEADVELFGPVALSTLDASHLWQTLYWLAATSTVPLPPGDVVMCTAAGWPAAMACSAAAQGTPVMVVEHGLYVREAYLESVRSNPTPGRQLISTRIARTMARLAYHIADIVSPVCDNHHPWEVRLGARPDRIRTIPNGMAIPDNPTSPAAGKVVVSVGRVDPLKDIPTYLRVARTLIDLDPDVRFLHYGPVSAANAGYHELCLRLHNDLGLQDRFRFMGGTSDPRGAIRSGAVYVSTSISEAMPLAVLEAMTEARPVVATDVGGCAEMVAGCGLISPPGDVNGLAHSLKFLLDNPELGALMGRRGHRRAKRRYSTERQLSAYREVLNEMAA